MNIWQRYLFSKSLSAFSLFLLLSFLLFCVIDLSIHGVQWFSLYHNPVSNIGTYYLAQFAAHLDLFALLSFLLSILKVSIELNLRGELIALQVAGISKQKLTLPLFCLSFLLVGFLYINHEWIAPLSKAKTELFRKMYQPQKNSSQEAFSFSLSDGSEIVYRQVDFKSQELLDVYWIVSSKEIWHIKRLQYHPPYLAFFVDHLEKDIQGQLRRIKSLPEISLAHFLSSSPPLQTSFIPIEQKSLLQLASEIQRFPKKASPLFAHLCYQLILPWISCLIVLSITPFAFGISQRRASLFCLIALSLFAFFVLIAFFSGMLLLAENQMVSPWLAFIVPLLLGMILSFWRFFRVV